MLTNFARDLENGKRIETKEQKGGTVNGDELGKWQNNCEGRKDFYIYQKHACMQAIKNEDCNFFIYLNLAVQRPMTSPWQTSSALNSEPSRVR